MNGDDQPPDNEGAAVHSRAGPVSGARAMEVTLHEGLAALEELRPEWEALLATCARPTPFLTYEWLATSWQHFGRGGRLLTVCMREGERLVGLLPLQLTGPRPFRQLQFAAREADYLDLVVAAGAEWHVLEALFGWLRHEFRDWDLLRLRSLYSRSPTHELLPIAAGACGLPWFSRAVAPCPYVELPATRGELQVRLPSHRRLRAEHERRMRKLTREHGEPTRGVLRGAEITPDALAQFFELHRRSWAARRTRTLLDDEPLRRFHYDLALALAPTGTPALLQLSLGGRAISAAYGFCMGRTCFAYMKAYDPDLAQYAVGREMDLNVLEYALDQGLAEVDLLKGGEVYKLDYTRRCAYLMDHLIARRNCTLRWFCTVAALRGRFCP